MPYNNYPYTNLNDLNLDWILGKIKEIDELKAAYEEALINSGIRPRKFLFIGDSWGNGYIDAYTTTTPYSERFAAKMGLSFGTDVYNKSRNAAHMSLTGSNNFLAQVQAAAADWPDVAFTDIIISGGVNDYNNSSTQAEILAGTQSCVNYIRSTWGDSVKIWIGAMLGTQDLSEALGMHKIVNYYENAAVSCGCVPLNLFDYMQIPARMNSTHHPSADGQDALANAFCAYLFGSKWSTAQRFEIHWHTDGNVDNTIGHIWRFDSDTAIIQLVQVVNVSQAVTGTYTMNGTQSIVIGTWTSDGMFGHDTGYSIVMTVSVRDSTDWYFCPARLRFMTNGNLVIQPYLIQNGAYVSVTDPYRFSLTGCDDSMPSHLL